MWRKRLLTEDYEGASPGGYGLWGAALASASAARQEQLFAPKLLSPWPLRNVLQLIARDWQVQDSCLKQPFATGCWYEMVTFRQQPGDAVNSTAFIDLPVSST